MNKQRGAGVCFLQDVFKRVIKPNISSPHLDFGCGDGIWTFYGAIECPDVMFVEYDIDSKQIEKAKKKYDSQENLSFSNNLTQNLDNLFESRFNSVTSNFIYHDLLKDMFFSAYYFLNDEGKLIIFDYNMEGISEDKFSELFSTKQEKLVLERDGFDKAYKEHTKWNLQDCIKMAENSGNGANFKTLDTHKFLDKYFVWVGQKK